MRNMFEHAMKFNQDISSWNINDKTKINEIFDICPIKEENKPKEMQIT